MVVKKTLVVLVLALLAGYVTATVFLVVTQRNYIYRPRVYSAKTPANYATPYQAVRIPNGQGGSLSAWWIEHPDSRQHPTLVYCHGNAADLSSLAEVSSIFHAWGWNALLFDYSGYGESSPPPHGFNEDQLLVDAQAAYDWALARSAETRVIIWGHSLGSAVAARLAQQNAPAGLILEGAFPNLLSMARKRYPWAPIFGFMLFDRFDTLTYVTKRAFPLLVMHGERDRVIPLHLGREVFERATEPKQWLEVPGIGHKDFPSVADKYREFFTTLAADWVNARNPIKER